MKTSAHSRTGIRRRGSGEKLPLAAFHALTAGEDVEVYSDGTQDAVEEESIMRDFASRHAAEIEQDSNS
jgi:hypothetical protein